MSSINALVAIPNQVPYCVSKGGIDQLTKVMALSLAPHGIRVNAIGPGSIMTEILQAVATDKEARRKVLSRTPLGRIGEPEEVAAVAAFLASDQASYVTGQTLYADGGRLGLNYTVAGEGGGTGGRRPPFAKAERKRPARTPVGRRPRGLLVRAELRTRRAPYLVR